VGFLQPFDHPIELTSVPCGVLAQNLVAVRFVEAFGVQHGTNPYLALASAVLEVPLCMTDQLRADAFPLFTGRDVNVAQVDTSPSGKSLYLAVGDRNEDLVLVDHVG